MWQEPTVYTNCVGLKLAEPWNKAWAWRGFFGIDYTAVNWAGNKFKAFILFFLNQSIVDLQCCINFQCTAKWFNYTCMCSLFHYDLLQDIEYNSPYYIVGPCYLSILYMVVCIC